MKKEILSEIQIKKLIQFCKKGDYFHNDDNYNQAIAYYNMAIEIDPKYRDVWNGKTDNLEEIPTGDWKNK